MRAAEEQLGVRLSMLERLTDMEPESRSEAPLTPWETMREYKAALCRDLAALLNTRRAEEDFDPQYQEATSSLLTFGVADFTSYNLKNGVDQESVRRSIERAIRQFEPRLARVSVEVEPADTLKPALRFQIAALLRTAPGGEAVLFDATLYRESRRFTVTGADR
jgi:type VI secretion system protein ImpF